MPAKKVKKAATSSLPGPVQIPVPSEADFASFDPLSLPTTGRFIVIYKPDVMGKPKSVKHSLSNTAGIKNFASTSDFTDGAISSDILQTNTAIHFENLGLAIVANEEEAVALSQSISDINSPILAIEPEYICYPSGTDLSEYVRGYRDAVNNLFGSFNESALPAFTTAGAINEKLQFQDTDAFTWGLQATKVNTSKYSGRGIKVAVLDTGFDVNHPDFLGRAVFTQSFSGAGIDDIQGHGTHCIGTACGPQIPSSGVRRYGIAYNAEIFAGKVFDNSKPRPSAPVGTVCAGIEWALTQGCHVASLSLGAPFNGIIQQYRAAMRRALNLGLLVVAAAGNNADRPGNTGFVEAPANADAAMAVAAVDANLAVAKYSARSSPATGEGGKVNIAGPGTNVFSSVPTSLKSHGYISGTSMATPHVAGIAALWAEAKGERGAALWSRLVQTALPLAASSEDVGAGLVQAPQ